MAGLAPNVALYLDEQPLSQPGRNLDVYAADLNRIEVLKGVTLIAKPGEKLRLVLEAPEGLR